MTISIGGAQVASIDNIPYQSGMNVQQAIEGAYNTNPNLASILAYSLEYFGSALGYELVALDAISGQTGADGGTWLFWELLINGQYSSHGIDQTYPDDGDVIGWTYTTYAAERHTGTRYEALRAHRLGR